ncbi:hypothetical protein E5288_WYG022870 [Bos mutus]|uniref:Uncharacterized protein n=1 Tax=Bos mutus TaxID=72004 RepID=A0A6B0S2W3_9CETA|nr:hypothetical protein [Bos mutus]
MSRPSKGCPFPEWTSQGRKPQAAALGATLTPAAPPDGSPVCEARSRLTHTLFYQKAQRCKWVHSNMNEDVCFNFTISQTGLEFMVSGGKAIISDHRIFPCLAACGENADGVQISQPGQTPFLPLSLAIQTQCSSLQTSETTSQTLTIPGPAFCSLRSMECKPFSLSLRSSSSKEQVSL